MFCLKKLLLVATTLSLVGTSGILPAQAIALHFQSSDVMVQDRTANIGLFCVSKDCLQGTENLSVDMSYRNLPGIEYHWSLGPLGLVLIKEVQPTRPKIPEPSPVSALLLLGCGWLLHRQLKTTAIPSKLGCER